MGKPHPDFIMKIIVFGYYDMVYIWTTSTMKRIIIPSTWLKESSEDRGNIFMSLYTGKEIISNYSVALHICDDVVKKVEEPAKI